MSQQVTEAFVQQFNSNVMHLSQQKGSRLQPAVRNETQKAQSDFFDRIGLVAAVKKSGRHSSTPQLDTPHSRRMVTMDDYEWADLVDDQDKIRMLIDPTSEYALAASYAFGRSKDDVIIASAVSAAYGGQDGKTIVTHPNSQKYAANDGTNFTNLNVKTLRRIKAMMDAQEVEGNRYFVFSSLQAESLLAETQVTSSDYNSVKALVQGEVNTFLGFNFIRSERLLTVGAGVVASPTTGAVGSGSSVTGARSCFAWAEKGLLMSTGEDVTSRMTERADKSYAMQVYMRMSIGATRMEEVQVVEVMCTES
jgi:hypothetical protein